MTVEKFYETLVFLIKLDDKLRFQAGLELIRDTLNNLVNAPAQPQHQNALASALATFSAATEELRKAITPSQASVIAEVGGAEFFDPSIAEKVKISISTNAMTPSVARDFVTDLTSRRAGFLTTIRNTRQGLESLGVSSVSLKPGSADLAFLIPRDLFENHLDLFAKELSFISRLIGHFSEALTGHAEPVELEGLSSSVPTVAIDAGVGVIAGIAFVVNKFLEAWERIEKIRKIRAELTEIGMKGRAIEELTGQIAATVSEVVEESIRITLQRYEGDSARKNELANALRQDTRRLFGQIERGLTIQFRAEPKADADEADKNALEAVDRISREMQFPQIETDPMLLTTGEVLEGELPETIGAPKRTKKAAIRKGAQKTKQETTIPD